MKNATSHILRPLGAFEELLWLIDQHHPVHFLLSAEIEGSTAIEDWRRALDELQRRHPFFAVRIEMNGESRPCFCQDLTASIPLRVVQGDNATQRWELEAELEMSIPFDPTNAPLVRAVLLHERQRSICILVTHHSIADGCSLTFASRDLLQALTGKPMDPLPVIPAHEEILGITSKEKNELVSDDQPASASVTPSTFLSKDELRPRIKSWPLTLELTTRLRVRARQEGTTVHGALSAAFVLACWEVLDDLRSKPIRILSPIDTRNALGLGDDCAVLIDAGVVTIEPPEATTFWEIARTATARLGKAQKLETIIASRHRLHQIMQQGIDVPTAVSMTEQGFAHDIVLTNLGNLRYATDFGDLQLQAVWGPAARSRNGHAIGVTTTNGALRLLQTSFRPAESLLETVEEILVSACPTKKHAMVTEPSN